MWENLRTELNFIESLEEPCARANVKSKTPNSTYCLQTSERPKFDLHKYKLVSGKNCFTRIIALVTNF